MDFSTLFRTKENLNLDKNTLTILRYIAIFGQFIAVNIVFFYLNLEFPISESYIIIFFGLLTNLFLQFKVKVNQLKDTYASFFLLYDLIQLSILLYLTGGILNPFSFLLIIPAIVSSTFLSMGTTIILSGITSFMLFFLGEYASMILMSAMTVILFLGGWLPPFDIVPFNLIPPVIWFTLKIIFILFLFIWVRGTFPRYRYDQLMRLGWKIFLPLSLFWVVVTSSVLVIFDLFPEV